MDNSDNILGGAIAAGASAVVGGIRSKQSQKKAAREALRKEEGRAKAQAISDAGGYLTLHPELKMLIPVPDYIIKQAQDIAAKTGKAASVEDLKNAPAIPATSGQLIEKIKNYLPWIIGSIALGIGIYFIIKKR